MQQALIAATALVLIVGTVLAYVRTRDVLHPLVFLGPLFLYSCVVEPILIWSDLPRFFLRLEDLGVVLLLNLCAMVALVGGLQGGVRRKRGASTRHLQAEQSLSPTNRRIVSRLALCLAISGAAAYAYGIYSSGGVVAAYSKVKGGGQFESGYVAEAVNLNVVAGAMAVLSRYRQGWSPASLLLLALAVAPNLLQGTLGGRRGPLFLCLMVIGFAWILTRRTAPKVWAVGVALAVSLASVAFVWSQRQHLYLGSAEPDVKWGSFVAALTLDEVDIDNNFVYGAGFVLAAHHSGQFTWGREIAVNVLARPIPRQVWPTKYEDSGATWVTNGHPGLGHMQVGDWLAAVGWIPRAGSSAMSVSDLFGEFSWGAVAAMFLIGRGFAYLRRRRFSGAMWNLLYLEALTLSIYLATQSFSAFYHRYLLVAIPTVVVWRLFIEEGPRPVRPREFRRLVRPRGRPRVAGAAPLSAFQDGHADGRRQA